LDIFSDGTNIYFYNGSSWDDLTEAGSGSTYNVEWVRTGTILSPTNAGDTVQAGTGSVAVPSYAFESDADTGLRLASTGLLSLAAAGTDILADAGNSTNCNNKSFGPYNLYDNSCTFISTGLSYSGLTTGANYTLCYRMRAWGGGGCNGFVTFCPYFINTTPLPIELLFFNCARQVLQWSTASEVNNDYFIVQKSVNIEEWANLVKISGSGTSSTQRWYDYSVDCISAYFRLKQVDYDGAFAYSKITYCKCKKADNFQYIEIYNILGQQIR